MQGLQELFVGLGLAAYAFAVLRKAGRKRPPAPASVQERSWIPAVPRDPVRAPAVPERRTAARVSDAPSDATSRYLLGNMCDVRPRDPTRRMMDAMTGPGLCTPPG